MNESKDSKEAKEVKAVKALPFKHRFIVAPMVDASDLAFRMLCRAYNADACFTPMFYADKVCLHSPTSLVIEALGCDYASSHFACSSLRTRATVASAGARAKAIVR